MSTVKNLNNFPFAAIIGQEEMKLALQLNVHVMLRTVTTLHVNYS